MSINPFAKLEAMKQGKRVVISDQELDELSPVTRSDQEIRTAFNDHRLGLCDQYIGWIGKDNAPPSLEYRDQYAYAIPDA